MDEACHLGYHLHITPIIVIERFIRATHMLATDESLVLYEGTEKVIYNVI